MSNVKKLMMSGAAGADVVNVEDVFRITLWEGNSSTRVIDNGIDYTDGDWLVWIKDREYSAGGGENHGLYDTVRGAQKALEANSTAAQYTETTGLMSFTSSGFQIGSSNQVNRSGSAVCAWSFKKHPNFFDIVQYTGNGTNGTQISHNLGATPGFIAIKKTSGSDAWYNWHRSLPTRWGNFNTMNSFQNDVNVWGTSIGVTDTYFTVGTDTGVNQSGQTYIAYIWAHHDGTGTFGADGNLDIIFCDERQNSSDGYYSKGTGFKPQYLLSKVHNRPSNGRWRILDTKRSTTPHLSTAFHIGTDSGSGSGTNNLLFADSAQQEASDQQYLNVFSSGFYAYNEDDSYDMVFMAIRGPTKIPETGTEVLNIDRGDSSSTDPSFTFNFDPDFVIQKDIDSTSDFIAHPRTSGYRYYDINGGSNGTDSNLRFDYEKGYKNTSTATDIQVWAWADRPGFLQTTAANFSPRTSGTYTQAHTLEAQPEMMWVQNRHNFTPTWYIYHKDMNGGTSADQRYMTFNSTSAQTTSTTAWGSFTPTTTQFKVGSPISGNQGNIVYLFSSIDGVCKIGGYDGNGNGSGDSQTITVGFTPRFVLIKAWNQGGYWMQFDTEKGIVAGNDVLTSWNDGSLFTYDFIDTATNGFTVNWQFSNSDGVNPNSSTAKYIYYAVA